MITEEKERIRQNESVTLTITFSKDQIGILEKASNLMAYVLPNLRKTIFSKDQCCQFKDPLTNKICGSVRFLEIDHIQPVWAGGDNSGSNLRILCSQHNKFKYAKESGSHPLRW